MKLETRHPIMESDVLVNWGMDVRGRMKQNCTAKGSVSKHSTDHKLCLSFNTLCILLNPFHTSCIC